jgi:GxxExxY protein
MKENQLATEVIGTSIEVHRALGPGLLERVYQECLAYKLVQKGFLVEKEKAIPVVFEGVELDCGFRIDLLIEQKLVVKIKSVSELHDIHLSQVLTYLKLGKFELGLLINFNVDLLKHGVKRVILSKK